MNHAVNNINRKRKQHAINTLKMINNCNIIKNYVTE